MERVRGECDGGDGSSTPSGGVFGGDVVSVETQSEQHMRQRRTRMATAPTAATSAIVMVTIAAINSGLAIVTLRNKSEKPN